MNRLTKYLSFSVIASLLLISCYNNRRHGQNIFHYNEMTGIASLDPAFAKNQSIMWAIHQLYNTLVQVDSNLQIIPSLAKSWDISPDRLKYTFHLRSDVFFHDDKAFENNIGRKLTAKDVAYSFSRITDKSVASPGSWIFNNKTDTLEPFKVIDDTTFQLKLSRPYTPIL